jgi:hypothetical protein
MHVKQILIASLFGGTMLHVRPLSSSLIQAAQATFGASALVRQLRRAAFQILVLFAALLGASVARAQFNASLSGTVMDTTQAAIPGARVILTNPATKVTQTVTSSAVGVYQFGELPPGDYTLTVSAKGFQQNVISNVSVAAETPRDLNVMLQNGQETQTVTVDANAIAVLQTADASIGSTIDSSEIQRLPIFGADPYELLRTAPGITGDGARSGNGGAVFLPNGAGPGGSNSGVFQTENQVQISADGQRVADNNYMIDGVSVNSLTHGGSAVVSPNEEAVGQITIVSTSYDASLGRNTGAQIQTVTKSGTNQLHGSAFFLYDQPGFNSFNKYGGPAPETPTVRDLNAQRTWAASLGGPIVKNKLFLFTSYQEYKQKNPSFSTAYVETSQFRSAIQAQRAGGLSESIVANPASLPRIVAVLTPSCTGFRTYATGPAVNNMAPTALACQVVAGGLDVGSLTPGGSSQLGVFPDGGKIVPTAGSQAGFGPNQQEVGGGFDGIPDLQFVQIINPSQSRGNQYNARVDWTVTPKDLIAGSVYFTKLDNLGVSGTAGSRPLDDLPFKPLNSAGTLIYIHTFSPSIINELRGNFTRFFDNGIKDGGGVVNYGIPEAHTEGIPVNQIQFGLPQGTGRFLAQNTYEIRDTVSKTFGSHVLRIGVELRREQDNDNTALASVRPVYSFVGLWSLANDAPVYEGVIANPNTGGPPTIASHLRSENYAVFIQHDWKATPQLTINTGLRWELFTPLRNKDFALNYPVLGPPGSELSGLTLRPRDRLWNTQYKNFGPKVGFAYNPTAMASKVVLRGGFALAYNHLDFALFNVAQQDNGPGLANYGLCCGDANSPFAGGLIKYAVGTSNSPTSYPINPALATGTGANGFPNPYGKDGAGNPIYPNIEVYGAFPNTKIPYSFLYSLETQIELPSQLSMTVGYAGSLGRHYARLVRQGFVYPRGGVVGGSVYMAQTDSVMAYNALNVQLQRKMRNNFTASINYSYSKNMDQVSNGDQSNSNANQTDPAHNRTEYGPSDYDVRHRVTAFALFEFPNLHNGNALLKAAVNGWQINGIATYHTGFPFTPVVNNLQQVGSNPNSDVPNPVRPLAYFGGAGSSCSNDAFKSGSNFPNGGAAYFNVKLPLDAKGNTIASAYSPGIGRNSFRGPCYLSVDMSAAKEVKYELRGHTTILRFQANAINAFNLLSLNPITNGNANDGANITSATFGRAQGANAGRVIEFLARFQF